ncbi:MAG TPA: chemotaxis protein CheW [Clostridiales bacterium]|nr:chemotaxis protein CheW [Clostridiales bacterium]
MEEAVAVNSFKLLSFTLGTQEYGIDISFISTIVENNYSITRVPGTSDCMKGVINLRGDIVPVMDLRTRINLPGVEDTQETKIIIVNMEEYSVGIKVDQVNKVIEINKSTIEKVSGISGEDSSDFFSGLVKCDDRLIILLDIEEIAKNLNTVGDKNE